MSGVRHPPISRFTTMQKIVMALMGRGHTYREIGLRLHIHTQSAKRHAKDAARKIPGDLPCKTKILFWNRGATLDQLTGEGWTVGTGKR